MIRRALGAAAGAMLATALIATAATGPVGAAKKEKAKEQAPPAPIESIKGKAFRMARTRMAPQITRIADGASDQVTRDGTPAPDAPEWSDISAVYVANTKATAKLVGKLADDYPPGVARSFYGKAAEFRSKHPIVFVAVEMAKRMPDGIRGQQVEIGIDGDAATPVQVGTQHDTLAGVERFSLSGLFRDGTWATGTTDVSGRAPGDEIDYYNVASGVFGYYDPKKATWYVIMPRPKDARSVTVSVRSSTGSGQVIDRLQLPGGGHFVDLRDPTGGFTPKGQRLLLTCRSLETFSGASGVVELDDPASTLIRYTAGVEAAADPAAAASTLKAAIEVMGPVEVVLDPVAGDAEPTTVTGELSVSPAGNAVSLSFEAPAGQWTFALADELELRTPAGESIIDASSLTGRAGVLTGDGLDGLVAGDLSCAQAAESPAIDETTDSAAEASPGTEEATAEPTAAPDA